MGAAGFNFRELRIVIEDELSHCYVLLEALGDCPIGVQGWHYKAFPTSKSAEEILVESVSALEWPQAAPKAYGEH